MDATTQVTSCTPASCRGANVPHDPTLTRAVLQCICGNIQEAGFLQLKEAAAVQWASVLKANDAITITPYGTFQGSGLGNHGASGHDPSMTGCTAISLYFISLHFAGFPLTATNMKNVVDLFAWSCLRYCRQVQGSGEGTEVFHDVATDFMTDIGVLKTVNAWLHVAHLNKLKLTHYQSFNPNRTRGSSTHTPLRAVF